MKGTGNKSWVDRALGKKGDKIHVPDGPNPPMIQSPGGVMSRAAGPQIVQVNTFSNPVLLFLIAAFMILGIFSGWALGKADFAVNLATRAEREGRLAEEAAVNLRATMRAQGIKTDQIKREDEEVNTP